MTNSNLLAISPIDGRYQAEVGSLSLYFSEAALIKYRIKIEIYYLLFLSQKKIIKKFDLEQRDQLFSIWDKFNSLEAQKVKRLEEVTRHDVKAIEYYLRKKVKPLNLGIEEYLHFALTSEDVNNLALSLSIKEARNEIILPIQEKLVQKMARLAADWKKKPMLARTHGQPAVPTTVGKEFLNFAFRLCEKIKLLSELPLEGKLNGAVGNFNAHVVGFPNVDWIKLSQEFIKTLGLRPNIFTTQILPADCYLRVFQSLFLFNQILLGFNQDIWRYISDNWFLQKFKGKEVGSSTMPQKVNPINFENSEGNLGMANTILLFLIEKMAVSRLQRDLSDSTVKRNVGVAFAHSLLAYQSCLKGLEEITLNEELLRAELLDHWEIVTEGIQIILRTVGDKKAYERLKNFARGRKLNQKEIADFAKNLSVSQEDKERILALTPLTYLGLAEKLVEKGLSVINSDLLKEDNENEKE